MTDAPAPERRAALVYNPTKVDADQLRALVAEHASAAGWAEPLFYETSVDDLGDGVTREALDAGASVVLVAGGDGTVRAVSQAMANSHVPLTIVPSGTGNLLARNLDLPLTDPAAMVAAAFDGEVHAIDVGYARLTRADGDHEEHAFVVMGGIGLDAAMIANTSGDLKKKVGWVAYVGGIARSVANGPNFHLRLRVDGKAHASSLRAATVMVGNCGLMPGGLHLLPDAEIDDGRLDLAIMRPNGFIGWLQIYGRIVVQSGIMRRTDVGRRILLQGRKRVRALTYAQVEEVTFRLDSGPEEFEVDGDAAGQITAARIWIVISDRSRAIFPSRT